MQSFYSESDAARTVNELGAVHGEDLAARVYTSQLVGREPALVLHGGGNTSVKTEKRDLFGRPTPVLCIKASGFDLATAGPEGFAACRLDGLVRCLEAPSMTDEEMVLQLRSQLLRPDMPTPSVEALLHALIPGKFVDHTHADAVLAVLDQPRSEALAREVWGDDVIFVPYTMPGFVLAKRVFELWAKRTGDHGSVMVLDKHGIFTWGATAEESYEHMIAAVSKAEAWLVAQSSTGSTGAGADASLSSAPASARLAKARERFAALGPALRGALYDLSHQRFVLAHRATEPLLRFAAREDLARVANVGCMTPDHVIRTKPWPVVLKPVAEKQAIRAELEGFARHYDDYFRAACESRGVRKNRLDPWPRVAIVPEVGAIGIGKTRAEAEIALDLYERTAGVIETASALGGYEPCSALDLFDVEYWSLEQAKLGKAAAPLPLDRQIAFVTGAASGIGLETAVRFLRAGAHVALVDVDAATLSQARAKVGEIGRSRLVSLVADVQSYESVREAVRATAAEFGGLDVVVSNAGRAASGVLHAKEGDAALRASLELNLMGHQNVARAACEVLLAQGSGGALLFNASKSAFSPGPDFGPYSVAKAAEIALMRQYAIDLGKHGIRSNAINADRVRTRLFDSGLVEARARARGVTVEEYFANNLLGRETLATDAADALLYLATAASTTGCVITCDGGNVGAFPR